MNRKSTSWWQRFYGVVSIFVAIVTVISFGMWVGKLENRVRELENDVGENKRASKSLRVALVKQGDAERVRLEKTVSAFRDRFDQIQEDNQDTYSLILAIQVELRIRFGSQQMLPSKTSRSKRQKLLEQVEVTSEQAEARIKARSRLEDPLEGLSF